MPLPKRFWKHALKEAGFFAYHKEIHIQPGEILHVNLHGQIQRDHFHLFTDWCSPSIFRLTAADHDLAMLYARSLEMTPAEVETLLAYGSPKAIWMRWPSTDSTGRMQGNVSVTRKAGIGNGVQSRHTIFDLKGC